MRRFIDDVKKYFDYEVRSAKSTLKTEVANSYLNWIWWILDPLFSMMVYYLVFGIVFRAKEPHFVAFLFVGQTMWGFFNKNVVQSVKMIKRNKGIVAKVYIPKFVLLFANMMVNGVKMTISWGIVVLMMVAFKVQFSLYIVFFIPVLLVHILITFSICVNLMHFGVFIEDLGNVVTIVMQLLFYLSGILYNIDTRMGDTYPVIAKLMTYCNPVAFLIRDMRNVMLYQKAPDWLALGVWTLIGLLLSIIGVRTIYKNENSYVKVI